MRTQVSPYQTLIGSALVVFLVLFLAVFALMQAAKISPQLGLHTQSNGQQQPVVHVANAQGSTATPNLVLAFDTPQGRLAADPNLWLEEPDVLASYAEFNTFFKQQQQLHQALHTQQLYAVTANSRILVQAEPRQLRDLPWLFWFQLFVGAAGALTGAAIYAFSRPHIATRYYALTGLGYLLFAPSAAIYSSRDFLLNGELFRLLSAINHFGALFFTASLVALLWHYPNRLKSWPVPALAYGSALLFWLLDMAQLWPDPTFVPLSVLLVFSAGIVIATLQGWRARKNPLDRAAFRWFMVSIFLGTGLFAAFVLIPTALNQPHMASQGLMFGAFLLMYWGLALGLLRYRLFELEAWWFSIWSWFLSGLSIVLVDALLVSFLSLSNQTALIVAVAVIGWLYFPLRQWLLQRLRRDARQNINQWLPQVLPLLLDVRLGSDQEKQIRQRWPLIVQTVFDPLHIHKIAAVGNATIAQSGQMLQVPDLRPPTLADSVGTGQASQSPQAQGEQTPYSFALLHAARGQRLFTAHDLNTVDMLIQLAELALSVARARDTGARLERERIARDIHDDLGARLLYLLQKSAPEQQMIVRETLDDLRHLLSSLDGEEISMGEAVANWRLETSQRSQASQAQLDWQADLLNDEHVLTAFEYHHLSRMLREAVTNAFKHSQTAHLRVHIHQPNAQTFAIDIHNDGALQHDPHSSGRGLQNMQRRAQSLNGHVTWQQDHEHHVLIRMQPSNHDARVPLTPMLPSTQESHA